MLKRLLAMIALGSLLASLALADDDVLALVTKGKVTSNSAGVTKLSLEDKMQVKGGYIYFVRASNYDFGYGIGRSFAYIVGDTQYRTQEEFLKAMNIDGDKIILAKLRYINNQKEYYLQSYDRSGNTRDIWAWNGSYALEVLNEFKRKY